MNRRLHPVLLAAGAVSVALYFVFPNGSVAQAAAFLSILLGTAVLLAIRTVRDCAFARQWRMLVAGEFVYVVATGFWYLLPVGFDHQLAFPSFVDGLYFISYALFGAFLLGLNRRRHEGQGTSERRFAVVDAAILTASGGAALWVTVIQPNLLSDVGVLAKVVAVAYPAFAALLFGLALRFVFGGVSRRGPEALLVAWLGAELVADVFYGYTSANGSFRYGSPVFWAWLVSYIALAALVTHPDASRLAEPAHARRLWSTSARFALLLGAALVPLVLALVSLARRDVGAATGALIAAGVTFSLVVVRLAMVSGDLREHRRLSDELVQVSQDLRHLALHDPLTGVGNRTLLTERLGHALRRRPTAAGAAALLLLDLDSFKTVNDTLGHEAGDALLVEVANRLQGFVRPEDTITRLGGDEFALVFDRVDPDEALRITQRVVDALREPAHINGRLLTMRTSAGLYIAEQDSEPTAALRCADLAMYAAKGHGGDRYELFRPELHDAHLARHHTEIELREAVLRGEMRLHYQPIIDLSTMAVVGVEALVHWQHHQRGLLPPGAFNDIAETSGANIEIGCWALQEACRQLSAWRETVGIPDGFRVAVKVSARQLAHPGIIDDILNILHETATDPRHIIVEVTESAVMSDTDGLVERLDSLRALGVTLAVDDFGTGYSSLEQLRGLPIDILKLDTAFIAGIDTGHADFALATALIRLAASLGKQTLADGVETPGQLAHLRAAGTGFAQGFLFNNPLPPDEVAHMWQAPTNPEHDAVHGAR
ncbi:MAG: EAL domain-containing protein [Acidimicrobiales bacterium]